MPVRIKTNNMLLIRKKIMYIPDINTLFYNPSLEVTHKKQIKIYNLTLY